MQNAVRVLQIVPLGAGGITSLILGVEEHMDRSMVAFDYMTFYDRKEFNEDRALQFGAQKYVVPINQFHNPIIRALFKFFCSIKVIHKCNPDIIHINASTPYDMLVAVSAKIAGTKRVIIHSHNSSMIRGKGQLGIMKVCKYVIPFFSDYALACSESAARHMFPDRIIKKKNYTIVHNGIDISKYQFSSDVREIYRKKLQMEGNFIIGHIGRFCVAKNHKKLIEIFEKIYGQFPNARLMLIGTGELENKVRQMVKDKGLSDVIHFCGVTEKVPQLLQAMDCFVLPSLYEGLTIAGIEAQASGLPTILSDTVTKEENITDLVKYIPLDASPEEWAREILEVRNQRTCRADTSENIRKAGFDIKETAEQLTNLYISLCRRDKNASKKSTDKNSHTS